MALNYKRTKYICYFTSLASASIFSLPPILFLTFREMYGISYTLLGTLVLVNFCTQLVIDLFFSFFGRLFDPHITLRVTPFFTAVGLSVYALTPLFWPQYAALGLLIGTLIFSVAAGLGEVLVSPTVAALPSEHSDRDMATLHSLYGYGVVMVVLVSTAFLQIFGQENWMYLALLFASLPVIAGILLFTCPLPAMTLTPPTDAKGPKGRMLGLILCMLCIFFGSGSENAMTNWVSTYIEGVLQIPKAVGDILGLCLFAILLALTRTWYSKYGKNIGRVLLISMIATIPCYLVAALSPLPLLSMLACVMTGICTSMLWPGTLIFMEEKMPGVGVAGYALMAAGGDFGASVSAQGVGWIVDAVAASEWAVPLGEKLAISVEQVGLKIGILIATGFPLIGVGVVLLMRRYFRKETV